MNKLDLSLRQQISQAYLAHRLNHHEFVHVTGQLQASESAEGNTSEVSNLLDYYREIDVDERPAFSPEQLEDAKSYLLLQRQYEMLPEDQPWTQYQRALYRRLSHTEVDPVPLQAQGEKKGSPAFLAEVRKQFQTWDLNQDGALSNVELDQALADPNLVGSAAAAAVVLRRQGQALENCLAEGANGVSLGDLAVFEKEGIPENAGGTFRVNRGFASALRVAQELPHQPIPLLEEDFDPEKVQQGRAGSCVLLSTLASLEPGSVKSMFRPLEDGQVEVRFADGQTQVVRDLTVAERIYHAKSPEGGRWPGLLEVAMGQRLHEKSPKPDGSFRSSANGISIQEASLALHGRSIERVSLDELSLEQTRVLLEGMKERAQPWLCGSRHTVKGQDSVVSMDALHNGISNNHAYTIQGYDSKLELVQLRNPWARGEWVVNFDGVDDGKFSMPLTDFYSSFRWVGA